MRRSSERHVLTIFSGKVCAFQVYSNCMLSDTKEDEERYLTASEVGLYDSGDQQADTTAQLKALAVMARQRSLPVLLGPRVYLTNGETIFFSTSVKGAGRALTLIKSTATTEAGPVVAISMSATIENLSIDGNVSPDPHVWTESNYDCFTGSEGLLIDADEVAVRSVRVSNVRRAGFKVAFRRKKVTFEDCEAEKCRGNFGDGFIAMAARDVLYRNCRARDFTRIGFVADTYLDAAKAFCVAIRYEYCAAEDGHHGSILFGGTEYNAGWWGEQSHLVSYLECHARRVTHRGFTGTAGDYMAELNGPAEYGYARCTVTGADSGFVIVGLAGVPVKAILKNCFAEVHGSAAFHVADFEGDEIHLINCRSRLSGANQSRVSLRIGPGSTTIDQFTEIWATLDVDLRDDPSKYYGSVGHFNSCPGKLTVRDWETLDDNNNLLGTVYKFHWSSEESLDLTIERGFFRGVLTVCRNFNAVDVNFERICNIRVGRTAYIQRGAIMGSLVETPAFLLVKGTRKIFMEDVLVNLEEDGGCIYIYNIDSSYPKSKIIFSRSAFVKNFERDGFIVRMNGNQPFVSIENCNDITVNNCMFTNTGKLTANEIFYIDNPKESSVVIFADGNFKSHSIGSVSNKKEVLSQGFSNWD